ncbi:unnamed protein product, partial [Brenthis ino]
MDFLDSIDFDSSHKKCDRVRSWYLYEQYKTLEKNQLDAAYRLKNKTYQERILKQELSERRARRRLSDQLGDCQFESELERKIHSAHSTAPLSVSDDLFESVHELHEEYDLDPVYHTHDSKSSKNYDDIKSSDRYDSSFEESLNSLVENVTVDGYLSNDIKGELEFVKKNIADNINLQLETVKENIECLEKYTKIDVDKITDDDSFSEHYKAKDNILSQKKFNTNKQNCVLLMWSNLVAFAYNIIKLNHDNCCYDCSSQFLIGILACDVLRRGICNMCKY